jgi:acetyl esterase/lipase
VPARREDLSGLPPAWIGVGSLDVFHDEDAAYGQRLKECGIECEMDIIPGAFHGFDVFDPKLSIVQDFRKSQISALKEYLFR